MEQHDADDGVATDAMLIAEAMRNLDRRACSSVRCFVRCTQALAGLADWCVSLFDVTVRRGMCGARVHRGD